jgi:3-isopropylmalate dehydratase small subunit
VTGPWCWRLLRGGESPCGFLPVRGFRVVVAARFADVFRGNALADALLPVEVKLLIVQWLWDAVDADPVIVVVVTVELKVREVRTAEETQTFDLTLSAVGGCWMDLITSA